MLKLFPKRRGSIHSNHGLMLIPGVSCQELWAVPAHREMLCYHQPTPKHFRPSSTLLDSSYPLVFLMRLEQSPWPGGAARCSCGMASVLELEGKGPELFVHSWHVCHVSCSPTLGCACPTCPGALPASSSTPPATKAPLKLATGSCPKDVEEQKRLGDAK